MTTTQACPFQLRNDWSMIQRSGIHEVCVVIPAFNPGDHIRETLESVLSQTQQPIEVVVVDDGSDEDLTWIEGRFPSIRLLRQSRSGPSVARNRGILATSASLIAFLDQDDLWREDKLERQVQAMMDEPRSGLCYCDVTTVMAGDEPTRRDLSSSPLLQLEDASLDSSEALLRSMKYFANRFVVPSSVLLRRDVLGSTGLLDPILPFTGDFDFLIRAGATRPVIYLPIPLVFYRRHSRNFSYEYDLGRLEVRALGARYVAYGRWRGNQDLEKGAPSILARPRALYAAQAFDCARFAYAERRRLSAAYHLWRSAAFSPLFLTCELWKFVANRLRRTIVHKHHLQSTDK